MNEDRLALLVSAFMDGSLSPAQRTELENCLLSSTAARQQYWRLAAQHGFLEAAARQRWPEADWLHSSRTPAPTATPSAAAADATLEAGEDRQDSASRPATPTVSPILGFLGVLVDLTQRSPRTLVMILGGALTSYFLVMLALIPLSRWAESTRLGAQASKQDSARPKAGAGSLITDAQARWSKQAEVPADQTVQIGRNYKLESGRAKVVLAQGVRLAIDGPAVWHLTSGQRLVLDSGCVAAQVPRQAVGFAVVTPCVEVVDLGTEFAVAVESDGKTEVYVERGTVELKQVEPKRSGPTAPQPRPAIRLTAGKSARITAEGLTTGISSDSTRFSQVLGSVKRIDRSATDAPMTTVWLGNLFDDRPHTSLADAMRTDTFRAEADFNDLGVDRVLYGGESVKEIAPGVQFDLTNLGWQGGCIHKICNDAWSSRASNIDEHGRGVALRLDGKPLSLGEPKIEDGIGEVANALITFHLDDIRTAGRLAGRQLEFVCDRAGLNDDCLRTEVVALAPSVHMVVLVSTATDVCTAVVDGKPAAVAKRSDRWSVTSPIGEPLRADGRYASFHVPVEPDAKYLTLIATGAGDGGPWDVSVWVGPRLEVRP